MVQMKQTGLFVFVTAAIAAHALLLPSGTGGGGGKDPTARTSRGEAAIGSISQSLTQYIIDLSYHPYARPR